MELFILIKLRTLIMEQYGLKDMIYIDEYKKCSATVLPINEPLKACKFRDPSSKATV